MCVPRRSDAFCRTTDSQIRSVLIRPANNASSRSTDPTFWLSEFTTSSVMALSSSLTRSGLLLALLLLRLRLRIGLARNGAAHDDHTARRAWHGTTQHEQVVVGVHTHDPQ